MLLKSIHLKNMRSYIDERIDFSLGSVLLSGDVGSGKSTILLAMDFALFGLRKGELEGSDLLRHGKNTGSVALVFETDGSEIEITRTLKRSKDSVTQDSGTLSIGGKEQELMPVELKSKILEMFGYPLEKKNRPIFRYTVYTPQEKMKDILFDADTRLATLRKIFSVDKYGQIKANSKLFIGELRSMKRENEAFSHDLEQKSAEKEEKEVERERVLLLIDKYTNEISAINLVMKEKELEFELLRKKISEISAARREMAKLESEIRVKSTRMPKVDKDLKEISDKMFFLPASESFDIRALKQEMSDMEEKKERMISENAVVSSELLRLSDVLKKGLCTFCGQKVNDKKDFQKHLDEKSRICGELKINIEFSSVKISKIKEQISAGERALQEKRLMEEYSQRKFQLEVEQKALAADVTALRDEFAMLSSSVENEEDMERVYSSLQDQIAAINKSKIDIEKSKSRSEQQLYDIDRFLKSVEKEIEEKRRAREKVIYINELANWFDTYFIALMDIIEKHVMSAIQGAFNSFFQKWFGILMGEQFAVKVDDNFSPVIEQNGYRTEYSNLSGGEKTAVALAYRLALNKVINSMIETIKTKDLLILDEPTDGFSSEQLDRIRDVIDELQLKQIILVSHEPKIDTFVDSVIKIYKEDHVSKVVY